MSITLQPREESGIKFFEDSLNDLNFISSMITGKQFSMSYPKNDEGYIVSYKPGIFARDELRRYYTYTHCNDMTDEQIEEWLDKQEKDFLAWYATYNGDYTTTIETGKPKFPNSKTAKQAFKNHGITMSDNEAVETFNLFKNDLDPPEKKKGFFSKKYNNRETAAYNNALNKIEKFKDVYKNIGIMKNVFKDNPEMSEIINAISEIDITDKEMIYNFLSQFSDEYIDEFHESVMSTAKECEEILQDALTDADTGVK